MVGYLDDTASEAQQTALRQIFPGQAGGHFARLGAHIGEVLGIQSAGMTYEAEGADDRIETEICTAKSLNVMNT